MTLFGPGGVLQRSVLNDVIFREVNVNKLFRLILRYSYPKCIITFQVNLIPFPVESKSQIGVCGNPGGTTRKA